MSREEILTAIQGLAEKLGRVPTLTEIKTMTPVGRRAVRTHFGSYTEALIQCGMETGRRFRIPMETLGSTAPDRCNQDAEAGERCRT